MGKKGNKAAPVATPTPQVQTPDVDVAQLAAKKALDAREGAMDATAAANEEDEQKQKMTMASAPAQQAPQRKPRRAIDPATAMRGVGGINTSAVLTG